MIDNRTLVRRYFECKLSGDLEYKTFWAEILRRLELKPQK